MPPEATSTETTNATSTETTTNADLGIVVEPSTPSVYSEEAMLKSHGLQAPSESELMGEEDSQENNTADPGSTETTKPEEKKPEDGEKKPEEGEKKPEESEQKPEEKPEDKTKPPKGFVPVAAVHEARNELREVRNELKEARAKLADYESGKVQKEAEFADFKVLTQDELAELTKEEPAEALLYINKLQEYKDFQREQEAKTRQEEADKESLNQIYQRANLAMEEAVPGIFEESGEVMNEVRDFAESIGFTEDMFYLTNPATRIILPDEDTPYVLGEQAADILKLLVGVKKMLSDAKQANTATVDEAALRAKITEEVEASLLTKMKAGPQFKSLHALQKETEELPEENYGNNVSEAEFASWPKEKQDRWLAGV